MTMTTRRRRLAAATLSTCLLFAAACGGDDDGGEEPSAAPSGSDTPAASDLGEKDEATGTAVKIGFLTDGQTAAYDSTAEKTVAEATAQWLNEYGGGFGADGHVIELVTCETKGVQTTATDCANQFVRDGVTAVAVNSSSVGDAAWKELHAAKIPTMFYQAGLDITSDPETSFSIVNSTASAIDMPVGVAKQAKAKKAATVMIDVPAAGDFIKQNMVPAFEKAGIELEIIPIAPGTPDMTAQLSKLASDDTGLVFVLGNDTFCISAFNGLDQVGYEGEVATIAGCISDATKEALAPDVIEGITISASAPVGSDDPSIKIVESVLDEYAPDVDLGDPVVLGTFSIITALHDAVLDLTGEVTPASVTAAIKAMPERELRAAGGMKFRCNGKADPKFPAICTRGTLVGKLDQTGKPSSYSVVGRSAIPD